MENLRINILNNDKTQKTTINSSIEQTIKETKNRRRKSHGDVNDKEKIDGDG